MQIGMKLILTGLIAVLYLTALAAGVAEGFDVDILDAAVKGILFIFAAGLFLFVWGTGQTVLQWGTALYAVGTFHDAFDQFEIIEFPEGYKLVLETAATTFGMMLIVLGFFLARREREALMTRLHFLSYHDALTGVYNRTYFELQLLELENTLHAYSIILADINNLKMTNDVRGHLIGDELIRKTARLLESECRKTDLLFRVGGDEFIVLLPGASPGDTQKIISRIRDSIERTEQDDIPVQVAIGYADHPEGRETAAAQLFVEAENRMYANKRAMKAT